MDREPPALTPFSQPRHPPYLILGHEFVSVIGAHTELERSRDKLFTRWTTGSWAMLGYIVQQHPSRRLLMISSDEEAVCRGFQNDRNPVQFGVAGVKDVSRHQTSLVAQWRSNATTNSFATSGADRPSIMWRCTKCTTSPSRNSATEGLLGA